MPYKICLEEFYTFITSGFVASTDIYVMLKHFNQKITLSTKYFKLSKMTLKY